MRGEGRAGEDKSSSLTGLNLIYPGLLVFYVEVAQLPHLSKQHCPLNIWRYVGWVDKYKYSVSEANIQITLLIVRRGALSTPIQTWANTDQLQGCEEDLNDFCRLLNNLTAKEGLGLTQVGFKQYEGIESCPLWHLSPWSLLAGEGGAPDPQYESHSAPLLALPGSRPSPQVRDVLQHWIEYALMWGPPQVRPIHPDGEQGQAGPDASQHSRQPLQVSGELGIAVLVWGQW